MNKAGFVIILALPIPFPLAEFHPESDYQIETLRFSACTAGVREEFDTSTYKRSAEGLALVCKEKLQRDMQSCV